MKVGKQESSGTGEYIRVAERFIESREFDKAMEQLTVAQRLDPKNIYIHAIIERIHRLAAEQSHGGRFLSLTVGDEFDEGIKQTGSALPGEDLDARVRKLTLKASELLRRGAYETAFDSLMNAYLLDPINPTLIESEKTLLPAIELMRRQGTAKPGSQRMSAFLPPPPSGRKPDAAALSTSDAQRLEELKRQKESQRLERERAIWREASSPPKILEGGTGSKTNVPPVPEAGNGTEPNVSHLLGGGDPIPRPLLESGLGSESAPSIAPDGEKNLESSRRTSGFFSKLRHGKFLS